MHGDNEHWLQVVDAFQSAALDSGSWPEALAMFAAATGSRAGQLIGLGSTNTVPFNWVTDLGSDWVEDFVASGGGDPHTNPFVRAGSQASTLQVQASYDFVTPEERRSNSFLTGHTRRHDVPYICLAPLVKDESSLVGLAVMRSESQGEIQAHQRAVFASIAPHVRTAVRTQMAMEHKGALLMAGALEALSMAVFVCNSRGIVKAMTPDAEALVSDGDALCLRNQSLKGFYPEDTKALANAIRVAASNLIRPAAPLASTITVRGERVQPLVLEIFPVPRQEHGFGFDPRVLVVVRGLKGDQGRLGDLVRVAYGLTPAETSVALLLADGHAPETIATMRTASTATVRVQIRSIYAKFGVRRLGELAARINQFR